MPNTNVPQASEQLRQIAIQKEDELMGKNPFKELSNEYGFSKVPEEIDGARKERTDLIVQNPFQVESNEYSFIKVPEEIDGARAERIKLTVSNTFTPENEYRNPDGVEM